MKKLFACLLLIALVSANFKEEEYQSLFAKYMKQHTKKYTSENFFYRFTVFKQNLNFVHEHNLSNASYTLALNEFADQTHEEFKATHLGLNYINKDYITSQNVAGHDHVSDFAAPESLDWRAKGAVTPVKNQAQCGSCWSFSATGAMEGAVQAAGLKLEDPKGFSEQMLVDCSTPYGNHGCNGGLMDQAFEYVIKTGGLCTETAYPYKALDGTCQYPTKNNCKLSGALTGYKNVQYSLQDGPLMAAIQLAPVAVAIEADTQVFQFYSGGVLNNKACGTNLDHGVLLVGYGNLNGQDYWIVKNSWGTTWGQGGYILLARGVNQCGINQMASYAIAKK